MTAPPHLLPLALEAMTSADAWAVFLDGLLESGWCTRENAFKVHGVWFQGWPREPEPRSDWDHEKWFVWIGQRIFNREEPIRAIAAVLLFGEWSTTPWPLVEAHEARLQVQQMRYMLDLPYSRWNE